MASWAEGIAGGDGWGCYRSHFGDRRSLLVTEYAALDSGRLKARVGQSLRCVRVTPVCRARRRPIGHVRIVDESEGQIHGSRFREGDESGSFPLLESFIRSPTPPPADTSGR